MQCLPLVKYKLALSENNSDISTSTSFLTILYTLQTSNILHHPAWRREYNGKEDCQCVSYPTMHDTLVAVHCYERSEVVSSWQEDQMLGISALP